MSSGTLSALSYATVRRRSHVGYLLHKVCVLTLTSQDGLGSILESHVPRRVAALIEKATSSDSAAHLPKHNGCDYPNTQTEKLLHGLKALRNKLGGVQIPCRTVLQARCFAATQFGSGGADAFVVARGCDFRDQIVKQDLLLLLLQTNANDLQRECLCCISAKMIGHRGQPLSGKRQQAIMGFARVHLNCQTVERNTPGQPRPLHGVKHDLTKEK
eukprot:1190277-Prorocentrum_minimum.AAC.10